MNKQQKTILYIIAGFSLIIFLIYLILIAIKNPGLANFDESVANLLASHRIRFFDYTFVLISYLGETLSLVIFCFFLLLLPNRKKLGIPIAIVTFTSILINFLFKYTVRRLRPQGLFLTEPTLFYNMPDGFSFPSGHAMQGVVFFMALTVLLSQNAKKTWQEILIVTSGIIISILTCFARVYLCVHYLSDVLCGLALALAILSFGYILKSKFAPKHTITFPKEITSPNLENQ